MTSASQRARPLPRGIGRIGGASHDGVDIGVVPHIEHAGGAGPRGDCENCNESKEWIEVSRRDHQSDERSEHRERHHARLHQRDEIG